jgi:hypothetical protein
LLIGVLIVYRRRTRARGLRQIDSEESGSHPVIPETLSHHPLGPSQTSSMSEVQAGVTQMGVSQNVPSLSVSSSSVLDSSSR